MAQHIDSITTLMRADVRPASEHKPLKFDPHLIIRRMGGTMMHRARNRGSWVACIFLACALLVAEPIAAQLPPTALGTHVDHPPPTETQKGSAAAAAVPGATVPPGAAQVPPRPTAPAAAANVADKPSIAAIAGTLVTMTLNVDQIDPAPPVERGSLVVSYALSNPGKSVLNGIVSARFQGQALAVADGSALKAVAVPSGASVRGSLRTIAPLQAGSSTVQLFFTDNDQCSWPLGSPVKRCETREGTPFDVTVDADVDQDGLSDVVEQLLLARFTPYFRFSIDGGSEDYRPAKVTDYVRLSELQNDGDEGKCVIVANKDLFLHPELLLSAGTDVTIDRLFRKDRFLNPIGDTPRHGASWGDVLAAHNVGLYGHVVPFRNATPQLGPANCVPTANGQEKPGCHLDAARDYYKVEYWQFFGYNDTGQQFGDHESDWCTVQLFIDRKDGHIAEVDMFAHGIKFGYTWGDYSEQTTDLENGQIRQWWRGGIGDLSFTWNKGPVADTENKTSGVLAQNRVIRLFREAGSTEYLHPVVYIEHGAHEFWPTEKWSMAQAPNHNGDDLAHNYLTAAPPNLGEVEHPLAETPEALLILRYNGHWGAFNHLNEPPQGPPLHRQWQLPVSGITVTFPQDGY